MPGVIGFDVGQETDPAALSLVEQMRRKDGKTIYQIRRLERALRVDYRAMTAWCKKRVADWGCHGVPIALDHTGCGRPFFTMLLEEQIPAPITPINIVAGSKITPWEERGYQGFNVPKKHLAAVVKLMIQQERLGIEPGIKDAKVLGEELLAFEFRVTEAGNVTFSARSGAHDDLVLSVALALWLGENTPLGWDGSIGVDRALNPPASVFNRLQADDPYKEGLPDGMKSPREFYGMGGGSIQGIPDAW